MIRFSHALLLFVCLGLAGCGDGEKSVPGAAAQEGGGKVEKEKSENPEQPPKPEDLPWITREQIDELYARMKADGLDVDGKLRWSFFFTAKDREKLEKAGQKLAAQGYEVANVFKDETFDFYWLHVENVMALTPAALDRLNVEFYRLAQQWGLQGYEGFQPRPPDAPPGPPPEYEEKKVR
ncbi:MAG: ribonuclease E inhibitor RraB [Planctomycetota bacterium]|nr:ribonuclease E inhibitor RraB [Planctomycetota bacterium]